MDFKGKRAFHLFALGSLTLIASALPFLTSLPKMIGEPFDTRFQIVIHEHWYWVFQLERPLRDVLIFYPFDKTLGYSDIFFGNGIIYSLLRFAGLDILTAWTFTNFLVILFGNIGFALLLNKLLKNKLLVYTSLILMINSYSFLSLLNIWPNTVGYALVSWVLLFLYQIFYSNSYTVIKWTNALLVFIPILTLSYWYPGFFSILGILLFLILGLRSKNSNLRIVLKSLYQKKSLINLALFAPVWILLWSFFLFIALPTRGNLNRSPDEIYKGSLSINDFFATDLLEPTFTKDLFGLFSNNEWLSSNHIWSIGFSYFTIISFLVVSIFSIKSLLSNNSLFAFTFIAILLALILTLRINNYGIYIFFWQNFDILGIIRTPVRINILINFLLILYIFKFFDSQIHSKKSNKIVVYFLVILMFLDQFRILPGFWNKKDFIDKDLAKQANDFPSNCEYFALVNEGAGHWSDTIEAMVFSSLINVPTVNGYSGTFPKDAIQRGWADPSGFTYVIDYINRNNLSLNACLLTNTNLFHINLHNQLFVNFSDSILLWEENKNRSWVWIQDKSLVVEISNPFIKHQLKATEVILEKAPCLDNLKLDLLINNKSFELAFTKDQNIASFDLPSLNSSRNIRIKIDADQAGCQIDEDPRSLIYSFGFTR